MRIKWRRLLLVSEWGWTEVRRYRCTLSRLYEIGADQLAAGWSGYRVVANKARIGG